MFFSVITFIATVFLGLFVALCTDSVGIGAITSIALIGAVIVYRLHGLYKALVPDNEVVPPTYGEENAEENITPVPEEESYGVNELDDSEK